MDDLFGSPFGEPRPAGKFDPDLLRSMTDAVRTGLDLLRFQRELGGEVAADDLNDLFSLHRSIVQKIHAEQSRRIRKAQDRRRQKLEMDALNEEALLDDDDDDLPL